MRSKTPNGSRNGTLLTFFALAFTAALLIAPAFFITEAQKTGRKKAKVLNAGTSAHDNGIENYDIRVDKNAYKKIAGIRESRGRSAAMTADVRDRFVRGENALKQRIGNVKVEYSSDLGVPEVVAPDVARGRQFLSRASSGQRANILKGFLKENADLLGLDNVQIERLKVVADYTNPDGNLSFVELAQEFNGVPVFRGEIKAGFTKNGEIIRVINSLVPEVDEYSAPTNFGEPAAAANSAAAHVNRGVRAVNVKEKAEKPAADVYFDDGTSAQTEKVYFPTEPGVVVPAWKVLVSSGNATYYAIVDAESGTLLWRKNLTEDQTQAATYNVYVNPNSMIKVADNPFPLTPGPINPGSGTQGSAISRTLVTLVGNEAPYTFNNNGWINDGDNSTIGNNVRAGLDRKLPNTGSPANPADIDPDGFAVGTNRVFDFAFTPGDPNTMTGDSPLPDQQTPTGCLAVDNTTLPTSYQNAIVTQLFYITNRFHDETYLLGFTEAARNFQNVNFTGQGAGNDRVSAQAQDCSGTNNANFTTPSDGTQGTMQMYLWPGATTFDGSLDADIVIHELTHGLSNRLHGNAGGLTTNMARGMGEGWSDFYAHSLLSEPSDPINGVYTTGGYATRNIVGTANYYYGIRRYPKAILAATGGVNNKPHNAFTFSYLNSDCNSRMNTNNFAFEEGPVGSITCDQVHNVGEIWSSILWEARAKVVQRHGWEVGNRKMLQFVTDGMKLSPGGPTMLQARDAILAAAQASAIGPESANDVKDLWAGFAARGLGYSASIESVGSGGNNTVVVDGFDLPNLQQTPSISVNDSTTGDNDGNAEPGETVMITVPLANNTGETATNVSATIVGGSTISYGTIANGGTASNQIRYMVPRNIACGAAHDITINVTSSLGPVSFVRTLILGTPVTTFSENFDSVTAPAFPGWDVATEQNGTAFVTSTNVVDSTPNSAYALDPLTVGGGTSITSPSIPITASGATLTFRNRYNTEGGWDGGVLEISIDGGAYQDILAAGGSFLQNGYNGTLGTSTNNPLNGRSAWNGNSNGFITSIVRLPAAAAGKNVRLRWRFGADDNTAPAGNPGWNVDSISVAGQFACSDFPPKNVRSDFDGDGRTDISVYRPQTGVWYLSGTTRGVFAYQWGISVDTPVPADYDKDGTTDVAVYRSGQQSAFYILRSSTLTVSGYAWGTNGDMPIVRDYDGDKAADVAVYRPSTGNWFVVNTTGGVSIVNHGLQGDIPIAGDFDGDEKADMVVFRNGVWHIRKSSGGNSAYGWGTATDKAVPADYDGDGRDDIAVYRPSNGIWYVLRSSDWGVRTAQWGISTDQPVPGDYDGDGRSDYAVYRSGVWWILKSSGGTYAEQFGLANDKPTPRSYIP